MSDQITILRYINNLTDGRPESFLKLLEERAKELAPDYPFTKHDAFEWLWAITSTLEGTELARQDWVKEATRLKEGRLTSDEFQQLCHNLHERGTPCSRQEFEQGCRDFADNLFGSPADTNRTLSGKKCPVLGIPIECVDPKEYD